MILVEKLAKILEVDDKFLSDLDKEMQKRIGGGGVLEKVSLEYDQMVARVLGFLKLSGSDTAKVIREELRALVLRQENELLLFLESIQGADRFEKAVVLARKISRVERGFFLKKDRAVDILKKRQPENVLEYLGYKNVDEMLQKEDVLEIFSVLRFMESKEWMSETFEEAYGSFTKNDFEERDIELKVLGSKWHEVSEKFVAKKHHNVSHLKEFGVIFLNPINENVSGKFLRDFSLLLHYFHEVSFYSKLFKKYIEKVDFAEHFKSLLRGDVLQTRKTTNGEWLIVQRYLEKEDSNDSRLFLPHVNPESMHWRRGERDLARFNFENRVFGFDFWDNLDWVAGLFEDDRISVSFDLEDNAMSLVSYGEGGEERGFGYHQREALWTKLFMEYVGGEEKTEEILVNNFQKGVIIF